MRKLAFVATIALIGSTAPIAAQERGLRLRPEIRPLAGVLIPTGDFRNEFKSAETFGGQLALELTPVVHLVGTVAWTHGHTKLTVINNRTDVWQYDGGVELNPFGRIGEEWELRPFLGVGLGGRTNNYAEANLQTSTCLAGYGGLGAEIQRGMVAFRMEGRDYLSCQKHPMSGIKKTRNDIRLNVGFALHLR
jgi:hypothetical protein